MSKKSATCSLRELAIKRARPKENELTCLVRNADIDISKPNENRSRCLLRELAFKRPKTKEKVDNTPLYGNPDPETPPVLTTSYTPIPSTQSKFLTKSPSESTKYNSTSKLLTKNFPQHFHSNPTPKKTLTQSTISQYIHPEKSATNHDLDLSSSLSSFTKLPQYLYTAKSSGTHIPIQIQPHHSFSYPWSQTISVLLSNVFYHASFTTLQEPIINSILLGDDILVVMPTGSGKSLTYQLPAFLTSGLTVIVQPLISLMTDQAQKCRSLKLNCVELNSNLTKPQQLNELMRLEQHLDLKIVFMSPEMLVKNDNVLQTLDKLYEKNRLARLVVDEAHCIIQWGSDFRKHYFRLGVFRERFPQVPIIALTASATHEMILEISQNLSLRDPVLFQQEYNRSNLIYEVREKTKTINSDIGKFIVERHREDSGLIYCNFVKDCEELAEELKEIFGLNCGCYYGEMSKKKKKEVYEKWIGGEIRIIVGTLAFGMGIDKGNVRFVVHYSMPESIEMYYQETGRAGRDGAASTCVLYYLYEDKLKLEVILNKNQNFEVYKLIEYCENLFICRRKLLLEFFGETFNEQNCNRMCDNCLHPKPHHEIDVTDKAIIILTDLKNEYASFKTMSQIVNVLGGWCSNTSSELSKLTSYKLLKYWTKKDRERLLRMMIFKGVLEEKTKTYYGCYYELVPGRLESEISEGRLRLRMMFSYGEGVRKEERVVKEEINQKVLSNVIDAKGDELVEVRLKKLEDYCDPFL